MIQNYCSVESQEFMVAQFTWYFVGTPSLRIYILDDNKSRKSFLLYWNLKPTNPQNYIPTNKETKHNPRKIAPTNLSDSLVVNSMSVFTCISVFIS